MLFVARWLTLAMLLVFTNSIMLKSLTEIGKIDKKFELNTDTYSAPVLRY